MWVCSGPGARTAEERTAEERTAKGITLMVDSAEGKRQKELTPEPFVEVLVSLARRSASGRTGVEIQSKRQREVTPRPFLEVLLSLARGSREA